MVQILSFISLKHLTPSPAIIFNVSAASFSMFFPFLLCSLFIFVIKAYVLFTFSSARSDGCLGSLLSGTPSLFSVFQGFLAICYIIPANIGTLINYFSFAQWGFYGMSGLALIVMRFTRKDLHRPIRVRVTVQPWRVLALHVLSLLLFGPCRYRLFCRFCSAWFPATSPWRPSSISRPLSTSTVLSSSSVEQSCTTFSSTEKSTGHKASQVSSFPVMGQKQIPYYFSLHLRLMAVLQ